MVITKAFVFHNMSREDEKSCDTEESSDSSKDDTPSFSRSIQDAGANIREQLDENVELEEEAQNMRDDKLNLPQIERRLNQLARSEVNANRETYRTIVYRNLTNQRPDWDEDVGSVEAINKIDELIDTSIQVWVDNHMSEFAHVIDKEEDERLTLSDIGRMTVGAGILQGIIENVSADAIYEYGKKISADLINWFIENTCLATGDLMNAIDAFFRALFGI